MRKAQVYQHIVIKNSNSMTNMYIRNEPISNVYYINKVTLHNLMQ
jgi:hypothetical protein